MTGTELSSPLERIELKGETLPLEMVRALLGDRGNDLDQKCCHCGIIYENLSAVRNRRGDSSYQGRD